MQLRLSFYFGQASTSSASTTGMRTAELDPLAGPSKHRKSGVDQSSFPWLKTTEDNCGELGMWCSTIKSR